MENSDGILRKKTENPLWRGKKSRFSLMVSCWIFFGWNGTLKPPSLLTLAKFTADFSLFGRSKPAISF
jgi:hypothetical protein